MTLPGFRELTDSEAEALRPYMLDGRDMRPEDVETIRAAFNSTMQNALKASVEALGRMPTEAEAAIVARAVVRWVNENLAPELRQRAVGLN